MNKLHFEVNSIILFYADEINKKIYKCGLDMVYHLNKYYKI